ncbi:hypothetical protein LTR95_001032 [Oleoguttula sp. CCFEE 5521]
MALVSARAARISSFWSAADPEGKNNTFRRTLKTDSIDTYLNHWAQLLTFVWNGWQGKLFPQSLAALAARSRSNLSTESRASTSKFTVVPGEDSCSPRKSDVEGSAREYEDEGSMSEPQTGSVHEQCVRKPGDPSENPYFHCIKRLQACMQAFVAISAGLNRSSSDSGDRKHALLKAPAIAIAMALVQQHLAGSPYESPVLASTAMLAVDTKFNVWKEPGTLNSHLSAVINCGQLWVFRLACDSVDSRVREGSEDEEGDDGLDEQLDHQMRRYFSNTVSKPLSYLLLWRRRLFGIAPVTMVNRPATWDLDHRTVTYQGISTSMDDIRRLLRT